MKRAKYSKMVLCCALLTIGTWSGTIRSGPVLGAETKVSAVGRENPFAEIPRLMQDVPSGPNPSLEPVEELPGLFVQTVMLKFLNAKSLQEAIGNMSSSRGTITVNEKNNSLIICDTEERLAKIVEEIKKADITLPQIMVEVVIVDVQLGDETEIGVNWDLLSTKNYDFSYRQNFTSRLGSVPADEDTIADATAYNTTGFGANFSVISGSIRNVVSLLQQKEKVEILASPRVMVVSGKAASIESVRELPYNEVIDTYGGGSMSSTQFKKVGVTLSVTATLTEGNLIFLSVNAEQNAAVGQSATEVPVIDTRTTQSEVLLRDGQVVILGGLRRKEFTKEVSQIPILGDIPLVGLLFKYTDTVVNNTELIVFLSPHIYKDDEPIPEEAMKKFKELKNRPMPSLEEGKNSTKITAGTQDQVGEKSEK